MKSNPPSSPHAASAAPSATIVGPTPAAGVRKRPLVLLALNWPGMLLVISAVLAGSIQPALVADLSTAHGDWYTLLFVLLSLLVIPLGMKAGEVHGPRRVLLVVAVCGAAGQALTAVAPTFTVALVGHALTALYTPAGPLCLIAMRDYFPRRRFALVVMSILVVIGALVAATNAMSGTLLDAVGWRGASWCLVVLTALALALLVFVPGKPPQRFMLNELDVPERLLHGSVLVLVVLGLLKGGDWGWSSPAVLCTIGGGILLGLLATVRARSARAGARQP